MAIKLFTRQSPDSENEGKFIEREFIEWPTPNGTAVDYVERLKQHHPDIWATLKPKYDALKAQQPVGDSSPNEQGDVQDGPVEGDPRLVLTDEQTGAPGTPDEGDDESAAVDGGTPETEKQGS